MFLPSFLFPVLPQSLPNSKPLVNSIVVKIVGKPATIRGQGFCGRSSNRTITNGGITAIDRAVGKALHMRLNSSSVGRRSSSFSTSVNDSNSTLCDEDIFGDNSDDEHSFIGSVKSIQKLEQDIFKVLKNRHIPGDAAGLAEANS